MIFDRLLFKMDWQWSWQPAWLTRLVRKTNRWSWKLAHRYLRKHQYNIIRTDLPPGYYDIDVLMEAALVKLLRRYVEDEMGGIEVFQDHIRELIESTADVDTPFDDELDSVLSNQAETGKRIIKLYQFFVHDEPELRGQVNRLYKQWHAANPKGLGFKPVNEDKTLFEVIPYQNRRDLWEQARAMEAELDERVSINLVEIVNLRKHMWT